MAKLERAGAGSNLKRLRRERAVKQQVQQQALMLEVQTLSMMLTDLECTPWGGQVGELRIG